MRIVVRSGRTRTWNAGFDARHPTVLLPVSSHADSQLPPSATYNIRLDEERDYRPNRAPRPPRSSHRRVACSTMTSRRRVCGPAGHTRDTHRLPNRRRDEEYPGGAGGKTAGRAGRARAGGPAPLPACPDGALAAPAAGRAGRGGSQLQSLFLIEAVPHRRLQPSGRPLAVGPFPSASLGLPRRLLQPANAVPSNGPQAGGGAQWPSVHVAYVRLVASFVGDHYLLATGAKFAAEC